MSQTVSELIKISTIDKIWLCPSVVHQPSFRTNTLLRGIECTKSTVPKKLLDMEVRKHFKEGGFLCIIWVNTHETEHEIRREEADLPEDLEETKFAEDSEES